MPARPSGRSAAVVAAAAVMLVAVALAAGLFAGSQRGTHRVFRRSGRRHRARESHTLTALALAPTQSLTLPADDDVAPPVTIAPASGKSKRQGDQSNAAVDARKSKQKWARGSAEAQQASIFAGLKSGRKRRTPHVTNMLAMKRETRLLTRRCTPVIPFPEIVAVNVSAPTNATNGSASPALPVPPANASSNASNVTDFDWQRPPAGAFGKRIILTVLTNHPECGYPCELFTSAILAGHEVHVACWGCPKFKGPAGLAEKVRSWLRYLTHAADDTEVLLLDAADVIVNVNIAADALFDRLRGIVQRSGGSVLFSAEETYFAPKLAPNVTKAVKGFGGWPVRVSTNDTMYLNSGAIYGTSAALKPLLAEAARRIVVANRSYDDQTAFLEMFALWRPNGSHTSSSNGMVLDTNGEAFANMYKDKRTFKQAFAESPIVHLNGPVKARFAKRRNRRHAAHAGSLPPMEAPMVVDGVRVLYKDICPAILVENGSIEKWPDTVPILSDCKSAVC